MPANLALTRRSLLAGAAASVALTRRGVSRAGATAESPTQRALAAAAEFLWDQQSDDGGWHSPQYGLLRSGQALTPFVLHALFEVPQSIAHRPAGAVERGLEFLREHVDDEGSLGHADPEVLEYPVYSTAYGLRCFMHASRDAKLLADRNRDKVLCSRMASFLSGAQFTEHKGFTPEHVAYGGWGFDAPKSPGKSGHMDLAHTRRALEALVPHFNVQGSHERRADFVRAEQFLMVVQKHPRAAARPQLTVDGPSSDAPPPLFDGGFYFSPVVLDANKGGVAEKPTPPWRSYATATCDGLLALLAAGVPRDDERVTAAAAWLQRHTNLEYAQGIPRDDPDPWGAALRFYHYAVRAEAYRALDWPAQDRDALAAVVHTKQDADGSFVNRESPLMKEDDPILCTALATVALSNCLGRV